jgi:hypothetical protein
MQVVKCTSYLRSCISSLSLVRVLETTLYLRGLKQAQLCVVAAQHPRSTHAKVDKSTVVMDLKSQVISFLRIRVE